MRSRRCQRQSRQGRSKRIPTGEWSWSECDREAWHARPGELTDVTHRRVVLRLMNSRWPVVAAAFGDEFVRERSWRRQLRPSVAFPDHGRAKTALAGGQRSGDCKAQTARARDDRSSGDWWW